jgi:hypothetical protein
MWKLFLTVYHNTPNRQSNPPLFATTNDDTPTKLYYQRIAANLQSVGEQLVKLGQLGGDGQVDGAVTDLDNETAQDGGVDL